jgi:aconitate hydratase
MAERMTDSLGARGRLPVAGGAVTIFRLEALERQGLARIDALPYSVRVLAENLLRATARGQDPEQVAHLVRDRGRAGRPERQVDFWPGRILLQDLTGVPLVVDLAGLRAAIAERGGDPRWVNPVVPVDLVIDHSVQVDAFGTPAAFATNVELEYRRNRERYALLRWAQGAFRRFRVVPPGTGIVHQVNLEYLASVVAVQDGAGGSERVAAPDTLVGTDSHTPMINAIGVLGWGVGGIEAEAVMLGEPYTMPVPEVVGVRLVGELPPGTTATDLVLTVTQVLRRHGVVGKFVEFFGPGLDRLPVPDRATIANMAPEYGATVGFFPVDEQTLQYLRTTGRTAEQVELVERYCKAQGLFRTAGAPEPEYDEQLELDLSAVEPSVAGPGRPEDRLRLDQVRESFRKAFPAPAAAAEAGGGRGGTALAVRTERRCGHGAVAIAAITSCTNTSNPGVMVAAGLLARRAVERGLRVPPYVKTSLAPGSPVVTDYLRRAGLLAPLEALGFAVVGYGCTTCIGNSGPLTPEAEAAAREDGVALAAVLSGNRNFRGRIHALVRANYLASPPLVVAYALAGTVDIDLSREPLGEDAQGRPVFLRELWPSPEEVAATIAACVDPEAFRREYARVFEGDERWRTLPVPQGELYAWDPHSTYIRRPPFFEPPAGAGRPFSGARVLVYLGDAVSTDEISPAGEIPGEGDAADYLRAHGVAPEDFHSYGARRGNHEVMVRGTFANVRLRNRLVPDREGSHTLLLPEGRPMTIFQAAEEYRRRGVPLIVLAGKMYGNGSSRDWAAKGPLLLGVRAVLAESFERIHRANLVGMGVLPLQLPQPAAALGLTGLETFAVRWDGELRPGMPVQVTAQDDGRTVTFTAQARLETPVEVEYLREGGILPRTLRRVLERGARTA